MSNIVDSPNDLRPGPPLTDTDSIQLPASGSNTGRYDFQKDLHRMKWITTIFEVVQKCSKKCLPRTFSSLTWRHQLLEAYDRMGAKIKVSPEKASLKKSLNVYTSLAILFVADNEVVATCPLPVQPQTIQDTENRNNETGDLLRVVLMYNPRFEKGEDRT